MKSFVKFRSKLSRRRQAWLTAWHIGLERLEDRTLLAAPTLDNPILNQTVGVQTAFVLIVPGTTFSDADPGDTLTLAATLSSGAALPAWLMFTPASAGTNPTGMFSGTPLTADVGTVEIKLTATSSGGGTAEDIFQITVPPNHVPSFLVGPNQTVLEDAGPQTVSGAATAFTQTQDVNVSRLPRSQTEVHIAVNPKNPLNLVIVSNGGGTDPSAEFISNSFDGGVTWEIRELGIAQDGINGARPARFDGAVAFDRFGNVHVAYIADPDLTATTRAKAIIYATSNDGGSTFSTRILSAGDADNDKPWIATGPFAENSPNDAVFVTYMSPSGLVVRGAKVTGLASVESFSTATAFNTSSSANYAIPSVGPKGELAITWMDPAGGQGPADILMDRDLNGLVGGLIFGVDRLITSTEAGGFDFIPATPDRSTFASPYLAYDLSNGPFRGRLYAAYADESPAESDDLNVLVQFSEDNGTTWNAAVQVNDDTTANSQFFQNISVDPVTGHVFLSWYDARNDSGSGGIDTDGKSNTDVQVFLAASIDGGLTFLKNVLVSTKASNQDNDDGDPSTSADNNVNDFGDYAGIAAYGDVAFPVWVDDSNSTGDNPDGTGTFDVYTDRVTLSVTPTGWATNISAGAAYETGQVLDFPEVTTTNDSLFSVKPKISPSGVLTYTPAPDTNGIAIVTIKIHDNGGGTDTSESQTFKITITSVNDAPIFVLGATPFVGGNPPTVSEDAGLQVVGGFASGIAVGPATAIDEPLAPQTISNFTVTAGPTTGGLTFLTAPSIDPNTGTLTYQAAANANGTATFTVTLTDSGSNTSPNVNTSASKTFVITVTAVNDAPTIAAPGMQTTPQGTAKVISGVSFADVDAGTSNVTVTLSAPGGKLTVLGNVTSGVTTSQVSQTTVDGIQTTTITAPLAAINATLANASGLTYAPNALFFGFDLLSININDGTGGLNTSNSSPLTIFVTPSNGAVVITDATPNVTYTATGNAKLRAVVVNGLLLVSVNGIAYPFYQNTGSIVTLTINGGSKNDEIKLTGLSSVKYPALMTVKINGGGGNDLIVGSDLADLIDGAAGNDTLQGGLGNDTILGGAGNDAISGQANNDSLLGGDGNDTVLGGVGTDELFGGNGNDLLIGGGGADTLTGDAGRDTVCGGQGGSERGGTSTNDLGDDLLANPINEINEAFKKLFAFE